MGSFDALLRIILEEPDLISGLTAVRDDDEMFARVLALPQSRQIHIEAGDLREVVQRNRRAWLSGNCPEQGCP